MPSTHCSLHYHVIFSTLTGLCPRILKKALDLGPHRKRKAGNTNKKTYSNPGEQEWTTLYDVEHEMPATICIGPRTQQSLNLPINEFYSTTFDNLKITQP